MGKHERLELYALFESYVCLLLKQKAMLQVLGSSRNDLSSVIISSFTPEN